MALAYYISVMSPLRINQACLSCDCHKTTTQEHLEHHLYQL